MTWLALLNRPYQTGPNYCTYGPVSVAFCGEHDFFTEAGSLTSLMDETCEAVCKSNACHLPSFLAAGPTPTYAGCCALRTGDIGGSFKAGPGR